MNYPNEAKSLCNCIDSSRSNTALLAAIESAVTMLHFAGRGRTPFHIRYFASMAAKYLAQVVEE